MQRLARIIGRFTLVLVLLAATIAPPGVGPARAVALAPDAALSAAGAPVFIENVGQFDAAARFLMRDGGATLWLGEEELWLTALEPAPEADPRDQLGQGGPRASQAGEQQEPRRGVNLRLSFVGANPAPRIEPFDRSGTRVSYFIGSDPSAWRPDVPVWGGVRYVDLYPGLDLEVTGAGGQWTWRLVANGGLAALGAVQLRIEGADALQAEAGHLAVSTAVGALALPLLEVVNAQGQALAADVPRVEGQVIAAPFGVAVTTQGPPAAQAGGLVYSTFLGGSGHDSSGAIAVDGLGRAYVKGTTNSTNYPTTPGAFDGIHDGSLAAFVTALNPSGTALLYSTFLGGSGGPWAGIAVDGAGRAYVTGMTMSSNYPTTPDAYDTSYNGDGDVFVTVLNPMGTALVYSTFLGGITLDTVGDIFVDGAGRAFVTGQTGSANYPTTQGAYDNTFGGQNDAFVTVLNPTGATLLFSTFLGGGGSDWGNGIAVDGHGQVYVTGGTTQADYPTTEGAIDQTFNGGWFDAFVTVLDPTGAELVYSTFLGGSDQDRGNDIFVDGQGRVYVMGSTHSSNYPTTQGAYDTSHGGHSDAFVTVLSSTGATLLYSTFLGGSGSDWGNGIAVDGVGRAYVTGGTGSNDYPTTPGAYDSTLGSLNDDVFVTVLNPTGADLFYSTFLGGTNGEVGIGIAVDARGRAYIAGATGSTDFPTTDGGYGTAPNGGTDAFVSALQIFAPLNRFIYLPITRR